MDAIWEYVNQIEEARRSQMELIVQYMEKNHRNVEAVIWFRMPTYRIGQSYLAFSVTKRYFAVHTNVQDCFQMLKEGLPFCVSKKRSIQIPFQEERAMTVIQNVIEYFCFLFQA